MFCLLFIFLEMLLEAGSEQLDAVGHHHVE